MKQGYQRYFALPSSKEVFVEKGEVKLEVLEDLIKEAYKTKGLYAECEVIVTRKANLCYSKKEHVFVTYKELWDCYRNLTGKEDYHPYNKQHPFSLTEAFIQKTLIERENEMKDKRNSLTLGEIIVREKQQYKLVIKAEVQPNLLENQSVA
jgi:hypothetical protein